MPEEDFLEKLGRYDFRGPPWTFEPRHAFRLARAFAESHGLDEALVSRDQRAHGKKYVDKAIKGLQSKGVDIYQPGRFEGIEGIAPTPLVPWALTNYKVFQTSEEVGGLVGTASHTPKQWFGLKMFRPEDAIHLNVDGMERVRHSVRQDEGTTYNRFASYDSVKRLPDLLAQYKHSLKQVYHSQFGSESLDGLRVVVDPGNGMGSVALPDVLTDLGADVYTINEDISEFNSKTGPNRAPEPKQGELDGLESAVRELEADIGLAEDADGDRMVYVDHEGVLPPDDAIYIHARHSLNEMDHAQSVAGDHVATSYNTARTVVEDLNTNHGSVVTTDVGAANVLETALGYFDDQIIPSSYQPNGHSAYTPWAPTDAGDLYGVIMAGIVHNTPGGLEARKDQLPQYAVERSNIPYDGPRDLHRVRTTLRESFNVVSETGEGLSFKTKDHDDNGDWGLLRPSGTEDVLRVRAENHDRASAKDTLRTIEETIRPVLDYD